MIHGKSTERRTGQAYQSGIYVTAEGKAPAADCPAVDATIWHLSSPGLSLYPAGQGNRRKDGSTRAFCSLYGQVATQADPEDKEAVEVQAIIDQQSGPHSAGRFFSPEGSCPKRRNKLRSHSPMTGCGNKSSHRCTIFWCQPMLFSLNHLQMNQ